MRPLFAAATILAAFLAVTLVAARHDARYSTAQAVSDIASGRLPGMSLATDYRRPQVETACERVAARFPGDIFMALAAAEIDSTREAAGKSADERFTALAEQYPDIPLIQYRCGAYFLARASVIARSYRANAADAGAGTAAVAEAAILIEKARACIAAACEADPENSVYYYEMAYSYLLEGEKAAATRWFERAVRATRFESGDGDVLSGAERLLAAADVPDLEKSLVLQKLAQCQERPFGLSLRTETLVAWLLSESFPGSPGDSQYSYRMLAFEDLSAKLLSSARLLRQSQASILTDGLVWRQAARDAVKAGDDGLLGEARKRIAEASYRYCLIGRERMAAGLIPQQAVVELDTPLDLRLDFSAAMQSIARWLLLAVCALVGVAAVLGILAVKLASLRQPALALLVLSAFVALAYGGCFLSVAGERSTVADAVAKRMSLSIAAPELLRSVGQPVAPANFDLSVARQMLFSFDYTLQAARVLAYVGTQECYDELLAALDSPKIVSPAEVAVVLRESTGLDFGYRVNGAKSANYEAVKAWQQWWKANRDHFPEKPAAGEFAGAPASPPAQGGTAVR